MDAAGLNGSTVFRRGRMTSLVFVTVAMNKGTSFQWGQHLGVVDLPFVTILSWMLICESSIRSSSTSVSRSGSEIWFETSVVAQQVDAGGLRHVTVRRDKQGLEYLDVCARLFVDASGLKGCLKKSIVSMCDEWPDIAPSDLCAAAQYVLKIRSVEGAKTFLKTTQLRDKEAMGWLGGHGGFSLLRVHLDLEQEEVSLLTGSIAEQGIPSGKRILSDFVERHSWIGEENFGGSRVIPLRRPYSVLGAGRVALIGDSASQVFAPHGSGIAMGMLGGQHLGDGGCQRSWKRTEISGQIRRFGLTVVPFIRPGAASWLSATHFGVSLSRCRHMTWMNSSAQVS